MNVKILIDSVVRQTTVLIAQLATAGGVRAPLAHVANQVFWELSRELEAQGVSRKVSADMFGMALRTHLRRIQWLSESSTDRGRTMWEAVLDYLGDGKLVARQRILQRFSEDDEALVKGVLHDLVESGLLLCSGSGAQLSYRATTRAERVQLSEAAEGSGLDELLWAYVYREGPVAAEDVQQFGASEPRRLHQALQRLIDSGRVELRQTSEGPRYAAKTLEVLLDASVGWEAAVYDHYQAVVRTICQRLLSSTKTAEEEAAPSRAPSPRRVGGSTFTFDVWPGHPHEAEVLGQLEALRERTVELLRAGERIQRGPRQARGLRAGHLLRRPVRLAAPRRRTRRRRLSARRAVAAATWDSRRPSRSIVVRRRAAQASSAQPLRRSPITRAGTPATMA